MGARSHRVHPRVARDADVIRIGTRASELALRQARQVQAALAVHDVKSELVTFKTAGDKRIDEPLSAIGAKGLFTKELEHALRSGKVECCVHSLKDLPTESPQDVVIAAILEREDPRDALVVNDSLGVGSIEIIPTLGRIAPKVVAVVGLGSKDKVTPAEIRKAAGTSAKRLSDRGVVATTLSDISDGAATATIEGTGASAPTRRIPPTRPSCARPSPTNTVNGSWASRRTSPRSTAS